jgi:hypothetical protein
MLKLMRYLHAPIAQMDRASDYEINLRDFTRAWKYQQNLICQAFERPFYLYINRYIYTIFDTVFSRFLHGTAGRNALAFDCILSSFCFNFYDDLCIQCIGDFLKR